LFNLQERGTMFVQPGDPVYEGMIIAEHVRPGDLDVNATKEKKLTNMRTTAADEMIILEPPRQMTLELALEYIEDDELIEVTPSSVRLRKRLLGAGRARADEGTEPGMGRGVRGSRLGNTRDGKIAGLPKPPAPHFRGDAFRAAVFRNRTAPSA